MFKILLSQLFYFIFQRDTTEEASITQSEESPTKYTVKIPLKTRVGHVVLPSIKEEDLSKYIDGELDSVFMMYTPLFGRSLTGARLNKSTCTICEDNESVHEVFTKYESDFFSMKETRITFCKDCITDTDDIIKSLFVNKYPERHVSNRI